MSAGKGSGRHEVRNMWIKKIATFLFEATFTVVFITMFVLICFGVRNALENERMNYVKYATIRAESIKPVTDQPDPVQTVTEVLEPEVIEIEVTYVQPEPTYTDQELEMLALVIYQEAGSDACSDTVRQMVGEVVLNRVADDRYPDTLEAVLTERAQYGLLHCTGLVWPERAGYASEAHAVERAYDIAEKLLSGSVERLLPEDVVFQAEFTQGTEVVAQDGGFYFCR